MNTKTLLIIATLILTTVMGSACSGVRVYGRHVPLHHDIYYRNPWHGFDRFPPPRFIGPPPTIEPPAVQLPIEPPIGPPVFEAVPLPM